MNSTPDIIEEKAPSRLTSRIQSRLQPLADWLFNDPYTSEQKHFEQALRMPFLLRLLLASVGGTLVFLAFPTYDFTVFAYFALVFHLWALQGSGPKTAFSLGLWAGTITNVGGFYWISGLLVDFGHMDLWIAWVICVLLCVTQGLVFALWAYLMRKSGVRAYLIGAAAFLSAEFLIPMVFPWYLGNSQYLFVHAVQIAELFGVYGVTLLLVLSNFVLYELSKYAVQRLRGLPHRTPKVFIFGAMAYIALAFLFGAIRIVQIDAIQEAAPKLHVGMVEGDIGIWEKEEPAKLRNNLFIHHQLSKQLADKGVDLIVWPESSYQSHYIWGSSVPSDDLVVLEADSLYTDHFAPKASLIMRVLDRGFGRDFRIHGEINPLYHRALMKAGNAMGLEGAVGRYPHECTDDSKSMLKCPFIRVVPDVVSYFLPSNQALYESRTMDFQRRTMPYNMEGVQRDIQTPILFGTLTIKAKDKYDLSYQELLRADRKQIEVYNTAMLLGADGQVLGKYHKVYLLLFGEYIPFVEHFDWIYDILPEAGNLSKGQTTHTLTLNGAKLAVIICYEDILPRYVRKFSKERPQIFVNITNDAWFGKTSEPYLHMALATLRSVEHRKWLVRSTNTGVSVFVDAVGRIVEQTSIYDAEIIDAQVAIMPESRTVYSYIGDVLAWLALLWTALIFIIRRVFKTAVYAPDKAE